MSHAPPLAKVSRPRLPDVYPRLRLFSAVDKVRARPVVWVSGPPGSGKTTLLASYIEHRRLHALWYQLDGGDADEASFFYHLGLAGRRAAPRKRRPLPLLTPEYALGLPTFSRNFFRELFGRLKTPFLVVFDNYQEVPAGAAFHDLLRAGLEEIPSSGTIAVISHGEPPPELSRLQANQAIGRLDGEALRLSREEMSGVANVLQRTPLTSDDLEHLHAKTRGWVAGVILLLQHGWDGPADVQPLEAESPQVVFDYFAGEVFEKTDAITQDFLLRTAWLPTVSANLAEALTGFSNTRVILQQISRRHLFTDRVSQAGAGAVYRYHPLFREFLRARARKSLSSARLAELQKTAAALLESVGEIEPAADLLLEVRDWDGLARHIATHANQLLTQGRIRTLEHWLTSIPANLLRQNAWLLYWLGACRATSQPVEARSHLEQAFERFEAQDDPAGMYLAWCEIADGYFHAGGDVKPLDGTVKLSW